MEYKCCDESNNTPDVIARNQLVVDVMIKPTYVAINFGYLIRNSK